MTEASLNGQRGFLRERSAAPGPSPDRARPPTADRNESFYSASFWARWQDDIPGDGRHGQLYIQALHKRLDFVPDEG